MFRHTIFHQRSKPISIAHMACLSSAGTLQECLPAFEGLSNINGCMSFKQLCTLSKYMFQILTDLTLTNVISLILWYSIHSSRLDNIHQLTLWELDATDLIHGTYVQINACEFEFCILVEHICRSGLSSWVIAVSYQFYRQNRYLTQVFPHILCSVGMIGCLSQSAAVLLNCPLCWIRNRTDSLWFDLHPSSSIDQSMKFHTRYVCLLIHILISYPIFSLDCSF